MRIFSFLQHNFQQCSHRLIIGVGVGMLAALAAPHATSAEDPALTAAKAAHAEIISSGTNRAAPMNVEPRRIANATPDEVAVRIALKLAQLRAREAARKVEPKRARQDVASSRVARPTAAAKTVGMQAVRQECSGQCIAI
ncbi:MAG: hypothetical protein V4695_07100 [Pseudomonadota bacterium]